jgi:hypothetical protein
VSRQWFIESHTDMDDLQQDFLDVAGQLETMSIDNIQQYVNFLSSRLRMMSFTFMNTHWTPEQADVLEWFKKSTRQELVRRNCLLE